MNTSEFATVNVILLALGPGRVLHLHRPAVVRVEGGYSRGSFIYSFIIVCLSLILSTLTVLWFLNNWLAFIFGNRRRASFPFTRSLLRYFLAALPVSILFCYPVIFQFCPFIHYPRCFTSIIPWRRALCSISTSRPSMLPIKSGLSFLTSIFLVQFISHFFPLESWKYSILPNHCLLQMTDRVFLALLKGIGG